MAQIFRPISDVFFGTDYDWYSTTGITGYNIINNVTPDDSEHIYTTGTPASYEPMCCFLVSNMIPNVIPSGSGLLRFRAKTSNVNGCIFGCLCEVVNSQATNLIYNADSEDPDAMESISLTSNFSDYTINFNEAQISSIGDWSNLYIAFGGIDSITGEYSNISISWAVLEVNVGVGIQKLRPISDINSVWDCSTGTDRYSMINKITFTDINSNDYIYTSALNAEQECKLSAGITPSVKTDHYIELFVYTQDSYCQVALYQGSNLIKDYIMYFTDNTQVYKISISEIEASYITDYTDLRLKFKNLFYNKFFIIYQAYLTIPGYLSTSMGLEMGCSF